MSKYKLIIIEFLTLFNAWCGVTATGSDYPYASNETHTAERKRDRIPFSFGRKPNTNYLALTNAAPCFMLLLDCFN
jgi:hypothetical protein